MTRIREEEDSYQQCTRVAEPECMEDDTNAAAHQSQNCIENKNIKYGEKRFSIWWMEFLHPAMCHWICPNVRHIGILHLVFITARCYASAVYAVMQCPSVRRPSVCLSVTFVDHVKTNKHIFELFSPSGSDTILVFPWQRRCRYSDGNPPNGRVECKGGMKNPAFRQLFSPIYRSISETVIVRWEHASRQFVSIEFSFYPCNI